MVVEPARVGIRATTTSAATAAAAARRRGRLC